jgi:hypothetical protein
MRKGGPSGQGEPQRQVERGHGIAAYPERSRHQNGGLGLIAALASRRREICPSSVNPRLMCMLRRHGGLPHVESTKDTPNVWRGTRQEARALLNAIRRHCACHRLGDVCGAHQLLTSQQLMDRLLYARRSALLLRARERAA